MDCLLDEKQAAMRVPASMPRWCTAAPARPKAVPNPQLGY
jgi:hypothetical protein